MTVKLEQRGKKVIVKFFLGFIRTFMFVGKFIEFIKILA